MEFSGDFSVGVLAWWAGMSVIGVVNIALWVYAFTRLPSRKLQASTPLSRYRSWQWMMSGIYVLGCASRSFILRNDGQRFSMVDSWISSVLVGRSVATLAEISFVVQWTLLLFLLARRTGNGHVRFIAWTLVPLIVVAEAFSWYGVVTTNNLGHAIEESIWAFSAGLFITALGLCYRKVEATVRRFLSAGIALGTGYIAFMVTVDVPTYFSRWRADEASGETYLTISEGLQDIQRYTVTGRWEDWQYAVVWMTPYFSLAVWMSLLLIFLPRFENRDPA